MKEGIRTKVSETTLKGVLQIERYRSDDHRGFYAEIYNKEHYEQLGIKVEWLEDDFSFSKKGVLRGLHGDTNTWKLVSCPFGQLYLVVLNYDSASAEFGKWKSFILTPANRRQILIPPRFANGHLIWSDWAMFHYKQSAYYSGAENQFVVAWDDPRFNIQWPLEPGQTPITSERDRGVR